jgi:hypothetical protein
MSEISIPWTIAVGQRRRSHLDQPIESSKEERAQSPSAIFLKKIMLQVEWVYEVFI